MESAPAGMAERLVEFEYLGNGGALAVARLVREKSLNSLRLETIDRLSGKIHGWLEDDNIACIMLDSGCERAFCVGADIAALYHSIIEARGGANPYAEAFFRREYRLDHALHTADKPLLVWGHGLVMGGGLGLMGGASHRIGTPATRIAMPEITIGLFPDAGGTKLLSALPDGLGVFAGLTGCRLSAGDALGLHLLDLVVDPACKARLVEMVAGLDWVSDKAHNGRLLSEGLAEFSLEGPLPEDLLRHRGIISDLVASAEAADDFFEAFERGLERLPEDEWLQAASTAYRKGSPTTARIFMEQMRRAGRLTLAEMFQMELVIACQCIRHDDFPEGVRALLIDKDGNPDWTYKKASEVPASYLAAHFAPVWSGPNPLSDLGS